MSDVTIAQVVAALGAPDAASKWAKHIKRWSDIYAAKRGEQVIELTDGTHKRYRRTLSMAHHLCADWASLLWTENAAVEVGEDADASGNAAQADTATVELLERVFGAGVRFAPRFTDHIERTMAKGCGALELQLTALEVAPNGDVVPGVSTDLVLDMVEADCIVPLSWSRGEVREVAFVTFDGMDPKRVDIREHRRGVSGGWVITNSSWRLVKGDQAEENLVRDDLPPAGLAATILLPDPWPALFTVMQPGIANNIDPTSPFGISIFANAEDHLAAVDLIYDNFIEDFELGGKMVFIPDTMLRHTEPTATEPRGKPIAPQKDKKNLFVALQDNQVASGKGGELHEHNPDLRVDDNVSALEAALGLLSMSVGMGTERYRYRGETIATATQIVSENSDLFRNRRKHMFVVTAALVAIARAALYAGATVLRLPVDPAAEVVVRSDDSVIEDDGARIARGLTLYQANAISQRKFLIDYLGLSEADADAEVAASAGSAEPLF